MAFLVASPALADDICSASGDGIDDLINQAICPVSQALKGIVFYTLPIGTNHVPIVVLVLFCTGLGLGLYLRGINLWGPVVTLKVIKNLPERFGRRRKNVSEKELGEGEITPLQALATALSGTVGLGNIAGVAIAISIGGPGATLWMIVAGIVGTATKFTECSLGNKFRQKNTDGSFSGGAMYYLSFGLASIGWPRLGKVLGTTFAIFCIGGALGAGNMFQANQVHEQIVFIAAGWEHYGWVTGLIMAVLVAVVIIGGITSIAKVTSAIVPFMGILYIMSTATIIGIHIDSLWPSMVLIFEEALSPQAGRGGLIGVMICGIQRATFSNEAGMGSAPTTYAAARTAHPVSIGFIAMIGPIIDTVIICTMTALAIIVSGSLGQLGQLEGAALTAHAFATVDQNFSYVLSVAIFLFAFSTIITWSYYGLKCWVYLFGDTLAMRYSFQVIYCLFTVIGAAAHLAEVIIFSDAMIFLMVVPNLVGLVLLVPGLKRDLARYANPKHIF